MPISDSDLNVWLDVQSMSGQMVIAPYIKSQREMTAHYTITVERTSNSGTSRIKQAGVAIVHAEEPKALSKMQVGPDQSGQCTLEVMLSSGIEEYGPYRFLCRERAKPSH